MDLSEIESENVSFLALLLAPDNYAIENPYDNTKTSQNSFQEFPSYDNNNIIPQLPPLPEFSQAPSNFSEVDYFSSLPDLMSLETFPEIPPFKYPKLEPSPPLLPPSQFDNDYSLNSILNECINKTTQKRNPSSQLTSQKTARTRIRDKMHELSKLMPAGYGTKKPISKLLEDAYKYVKFLQMQVSVLESMPAVSRVSDGGGGRGRLARLTRQQMLQIAVNSPKMQNIMAENGMCVVSAENLVQFKRAEIRRSVVRQILANIPT